MPERPGIADLVTAGLVEVLGLPRSGHVVTLGEDRELLFREIKRFL